jgi:outer membrane murein-binding lipoprotein Lpp
MIRIALLASCLVAATVLSGCSNSISSSDLRDNWTPEVKSLTMSHEELTNSRSRHRHNTWRQIHDDWATLWFENRNLRLTEYNLP